LVSSTVPRGSQKGQTQGKPIRKRLRILMHVVKLWKLQHGSIINVQWQIASEFHLHAFALRATIADDGRRVGIMWLRMHHHLRFVSL
jgi:hypothetical protein